MVIKNDGCRFTPCQEGMRTGRSRGPTTAFADVHVVEVSLSDVDTGVYPERLTLGSTGRRRRQATAGVRRQ